MEILYYIYGIIGMIASGLIPLGLLFLAVKFADYLNKDE